MVDHVAGHAAINADVLARYEARLVGGKIENHVRDVHRVADASGKVLGCIGSIVLLARCINPSRRKRTDSTIWLQVIMPK